MFADQKALLDQAITAVTNWRNTAAGFGIELNQINFVFPDSQPIIFMWDQVSLKWKIIAQG